MRLLPLAVILFALPALAAEPSFQVVSYHDIRGVGDSLSRLTNSAAMC